jgi:hypothetical protein
MRAGLRISGTLVAALALSGCIGTIDYRDMAPMRIGDAVYVDPAYGRFEHAALISMVGRARRRLIEFYGEQRSADPDVIFCMTQACSTHFSGPDIRSRALGTGSIGPGGSYRAPRPTVVIVRHGTTAENVLVHEFSHIEHHARFGTGRAPTWFHEGVAVYMSGEPDCSGVTDKGIDDLSRLSGANAWGQYTNDRSRLRPTYCQASAEIRAWLQRSGKPALLKLMDEVKSGKPFADIYGPLGKAAP